MNEIKEGLVELAKQEQAKAMLQRGLFNSNHEAYSVLREEMEEAGDSGSAANDVFELIWLNVKNDCLAPDDLRALHTNLLHMGAEVVQCLAMIQKWLLLYEDPRVDAEAHQG